MRRQTRTGGELRNYLSQSGRVELHLQLLPELMNQLCIGQRTMAAVDLQAVARNQAVEVVLGMLRKQFARQLDSAQYGCAKVDIDATEFIFQKAVIETRVVGNEQPSGQTLGQCWRQCLECWRLGDHRIADAGQ